MQPNLGPKRWRSKTVKFLVVGSTADVEAVTSEGREVVDLHVHPFTTPIYGPMYLSFSEATNAEVMMEELEAYAAAHPELEAIRGGQWGVGVCPGNNPSKEILDAIVPDRPVTLLEQTSHSMWLNSG
jgi:predicted amidohydrolase YtcJ